MSAGAIVALLLAAGVVAFVVAPLLRRDAAEAERVVAARSEGRDLHSRQDMLLASLKDLEDDRATGKLGDADYEQIHARLSAEAIEVMKRLDEIKADHERRAARSPRRPVPHPSSSHVGPEK